MELKLGICNLPEPIYLYVNKGDWEGKSYCWYYHDPETKINTPEYSPAICGYLSELRLTPKDFKGKDNMKLDIVLSADKTYIIRSGIETNFTKGFLLAIALVKDLSRPIIIGCSPGEQNTVFCRIYDALTKSKVEVDWNVQTDWASIIKSIQAKLGAIHQLPSEQTSLPNKSLNQDLRIKEIRTLLNYPTNLIVEWLSFQGVKKPSELSPETVDILVRTICLDWAEDKFSHSSHAANSYNKHVVNAVANGVEELVAIRDWYDYVMSRQQTKN
ncbi:MAG: hypothetical protein RMY36_030945 [Nostoc sp. SerVER01]|nr:hypothetical protein [Nostoc sp. SerVER01]